MMTQLEGHAITGNQAGWDFYIMGDCLVAVQRPLAGYDVLTWHFLIQTAASPALLIQDNHFFSG